MKTTHITKPHDVAVYRKLKTDTASYQPGKRLSLTSGMRNLQNHNRKTQIMLCISKGFQKCDIHPFKCREQISPHRAHMLTLKGLTY